MKHVLQLRTAPSLRVDARALLPASLRAMTREEVLRLPLAQGRERVPLGEWFAVESAPDGDALRLEGDLSRFDCVGAGMDDGELDVHGSVGDALGLGMAGGVLKVEGSARDLAGCAMRGGWLEVSGDVGDFAASALPGDLDGMQGGTLLVHGRAGDRLADRLRRGTVVVHGDAGDFLAARMVAGTVALGGRCGAHAGWGMRRGTLVFATEAPRPAGTFVAVQAETQVVWQLLSRDLARFAGVFEGLPRRAIARWVGDRAVQGLGEWMLPR